MSSANLFNKSHCLPDASALWFLKPSPSTWDTKACVHSFVLVIQLMHTSPLLQAYYRLEADLARPTDMMYSVW